MENLQIIFLMKIKFMKSINFKYSIKTYRKYIEDEDFKKHINTNSHNLDFKFLNDNFKIQSPYHSYRDKKKEYDYSEYSMNEKTNYDKKNKINKKLLKSPLMYI